VPKTWLVSTTRQEAVDIFGHRVIDVGFAETVKACDYLGKLLSNRQR
jgi:hypothetical protein